MLALVVAGVTTLIYTLKRYRNNVINVAFEDILRAKPIVILVPEPTIVLESKPTEALLPKPKPLMYHPDLAVHADGTGDVWDSSIKSYRNIYRP